MRRSCLIVILILATAAAARAQTVAWSDWYEDPKVPGIALRQMCDSAVNELRVEVKNLTVDQMWLFEAANKLIKGYKGDEYELYPGQVVELFRPARGCGNPRKLEFRVGIESIAGKQGEYVSFGRGARFGFKLENDKLEISDLRLEDKSYLGTSWAKTGRTWFRPCWGGKSDTTSVRLTLEHFRQGSFQDEVRFSSPIVTGKFFYSGLPDISILQNESLTESGTPQSARQALVPRSDCIRISMWTWDYHRLVVGWSAKNTCDIPLHVRACAALMLSSYICADSRLSFGESITGGEPGKGPTDFVTHKTDIYAWAAEGGEAAKRWVQSHRPETGKGCGNAPPAPIKIEDAHAQ